MRRNDVASTSFRRRVPTRFLINQCQIFTFLILKYDIIENSRIKLRGIVLPVQVGGLLGGGGGGRKGYVGPPPSQIIGGPGPPAPPLFLRLSKLNDMQLSSSTTEAPGGSYASQASMVLDSLTGTEFILFLAVNPVHI